jgi:hypothetical protein
MKSRGASRMKQERRRVKRKPESGFALLYVFVLAAAIAITLYIEVPRVAFESQRAREQMTIDRALQYQRAIQLFYRKYRLYPQTLDDLETSKNVRFLRHRYLDPLTGKDFRLLHVGPSGQLTDSLVQPPAPLGGATGTGSAIGGPGAGSGSAQNSSQPSSPSANASQPTDPNNPNAPVFDPLNMAARRPSDRVIGAGGGGAAGGGTPVDQAPPDPDPNQPQQPPPPDPNQPAQPVQQPVQPGQPVLPGQPGIPGQPVQQPPDPNQPVQQPTDPNQPNQPQFPVQQPPLDPSQQPQVPGQQPQFPVQQPQFGGQPVPSNAPPGATPVPGQPFPFQQQNPGQFGPQSAVPGAAAGGANAQSSAGNMIQQLLTNPRQPPSSAGSFTTGNTGGIAGVASTAEGKGIHIVNDHTKYKEWEFIYDLKKDKTVIGAAGVAQQQQVQQQMQQPGGLSGAPGSSPFGSSTFGSNTSNPTTPTPTTSSAPSTPTTPPPQ